MWGFRLGKVLRWDCELKLHALLSFLGMDTNNQISAEIHSDDGKAGAHFDALPWFEAATETSVKELADCGWCCDYPANRVALDHPDPRREIATVFDYIETINDSGHSKIGYEVSVDPLAAIKWLKQNRPEWVWISELELQ